MAANSQLSWFELPEPLIAPTLGACRLFNTLLDRAFYDVPALERGLLDHGESVAPPAGEAAPASGARIDLSASRDPEGALLVIDAAKAPCVRAFHDVGAFLSCEDETVTAIATASITGVGSSALGSAALAWDISTAFGAPVLAIVPGYGVADALLQALGGWWGFGFYDALNAKSHLQTILAAVAPKTAAIGRNLSASSPGSTTLANGGPVFRTGSGSSDVLHDLMIHRPIRCVVGHSKGALEIANALGSLDPARTVGLRIVTLGCPIAEALPGACYHQYLGWFDALGALNAWGNSPDAWIAADHSTNASLPLSMDARNLVAR